MDKDAARHDEAAERDGMIELPGPRLDDHLADRDQYAAGGEDWQAVAADQG